MILGRSTIQWTGLVSATTALIQVMIVTLAPGLDPVAVATILGSITVFLGVLIAFVANSSTTPTADPQLKAGTMVRVTDDGGTVIGHLPVPMPDVPVDAGLTP